MGRGRQPFKKRFEVRRQFPRARQPHAEILRTAGVWQFAVQKQVGDFFITRLRRELSYIKAAIIETIARGLGRADRRASGDDALESSREIAFPS